MQVIEFGPGNKQLQRKFIQLPFDLYRHDPNWVPPLLFDMRKIFNRKHHAFYQHGKAQFLLAMEDDHPIGRLVMLVNRHPEHDKDQKLANFYLFEVKNDINVAHQLLDKGVAWAQNQGAKKIFGSKGMTPLDGLGLLVKGFEHRPAFGMPYNPDYYPAFLLDYGFSVESEIVSGHIDPDTFKLPEKVIHATNLVMKRKGLRILAMHSHNDLKRAISYLGKMYNAALVGTEGNIPLSETDMNTITQGLLWIAQPELIKIILKDDCPVGFLLAYPDISQALQATKGRILPFGWIRLLWEKYHTAWLNINGIGIIDEYRGIAGTALLFSELHKSVITLKQFKHVEVVQIGNENERMLRELRNMGIDFYKTHAMFELNI